MPFNFHIGNSDNQFAFLLSLLFVAAYVSTGYLIFHHFTTSGSISVIGAGNGLALATLLIGGKRYWWLVLIGALLLNLVIYSSLLLVISMTITNVIEALVGLHLVNRYIPFGGYLSSLPSYLKLILFGGVLPALLASVLGSSIMLFADFSPQTSFWDDAIHWWMGDTLGVTLFTPLIIAWGMDKIELHKGKDLAEYIIIVALSLLAGQIVYLNLFSKYLTDTPKGYWLFFAVTVVALRTGIRGVTLVITILAFQALIGAYNEIGFFAHDIARAGLNNYWAYMLILSIIGVSITSRIIALEDAQETIRNLAFYDVLTQLPNRRLLSDRLSFTFANLRRNKCYAAIMVIDLDNFKPLNDTYGHQLGDVMLSEVALRLKSCVREVDTVARLGGDEFVVLLNELEQDNPIAETHAKFISEKILGVLAEPHVLQKTTPEGSGISFEHICTASIGVVVFNEHECYSDELFKLADFAMYRAKESGGNCVSIHGSN